MTADRTFLRCILAVYDMPAVAADPDRLCVFGKYAALFYVLEQLPIPLFMCLFDCRHTFKQERDVIEAFFPCLLRHPRVHLRPLFVFSLGSGLQVIRCAADFSSAEKLEPELGMLFFIGCSLLKNSGYLLIALLFRFGGKIGLFIACLALTGKSLP